VTSPSLGESTPPQGVDGLILSDPNFLDPWRRIVGLVHDVQESQDILHHAKQPLIDMVSERLLQLFLEVP
jgi:hypothetical protein